MATSTKIKVSDIAKDFNMASKDIIELLGAYSKEEKKSSSSLTEEEIGLLFDLLTVKYEVSSFTCFFYVLSCFVPVQVENLTMISKTQRMRFLHTLII